MNALLKNQQIYTIRERIQRARDQVARNPKADYAFNRGPDYAKNLLAYSPEKLAQLPKECTNRFIGVGNPLSLGNIFRGETVVDHSCGCGMDLFLAAQRLGDTGALIGVEMSDSMRDCASVSAELMNLQNVSIRKGVIESLPVEDKSVDVLISNGAINYSLDKEKAILEILRVLKPGGRVYLSAVVTQYTLPETLLNHDAVWLSGLANASHEDHLLAELNHVGLDQVAIVRRFDCFSDSQIKQDLPQDLFAYSVNLYACKPNRL